LNFGGKKNALTQRDGSNDKHFLQHLTVKTMRNGTFFALFLKQKHFFKKNFDISRNTPLNLPRRSSTSPNHS